MKKLAFLITCLSFTTTSTLRADEPAPSSPPTVEQPATAPAPAASEVQPAEVAPKQVSKAENETTTNNEWSPWLIAAGILVVAVVGIICAKK